MFTQASEYHVADVLAWTDVDKRGAIRRSYGEPDQSTLVKNAFDSSIHRSRQTEVNVPTARPCPKCDGRPLPIIGRLQQHPIQSRVQVGKLICTWLVAGERKSGAMR